MTAARRAALCAAAALFVAPAAGAQPRGAIEITPGRAQAFKVAIQSFSDEAQPPNPSRARDLRGAIEEGLVVSGVLESIPLEAFLGAEQTGELAGDRRGDCPDWVQGGADGLVEGRIASEAGTLVVEFAVWDTARCQRLARETLRRPAAQGPFLARWVADRIVAGFTGTPGSAATEIAFISDRSGEKEVFVMNADGSQQRSATRSRTIKAFPYWMPNGDAILYTAYHDNTQPGLFLTARSARVRAGRILADLFPGTPQYRGVFDPSGEELAVVTSRNDAAEIFVVPHQGGRARRITRSPAIDISPSWSPDGKQIVFVSDRSGAPQLYVTDRDGRETRRLTFQGTYNTAPAWSPDGRWIAYETRLESQFDIWLIDPAGEINVPLVQHRRSDETPHWSPDGRRIVFASNRRGRYDIYSVSVAGGDAVRLTRGAGRNTHPVWGPLPQP